MIDDVIYNKNMNSLAIAINYCKENISHDDIINTLYNDDDLKKQFCLIELKYIRNQKEADILVFNLTNHSGPIRETSSFKILELIKQSQYTPFFQTDEIMHTIVNAVTDINPSVSRNSVEIIKYINNVHYLYDKFIIEIEKNLENIDIQEQSRSYKLNKKNFSIYWLLEAVANLADKLYSDDKLIKILTQTALSNDYTIREKTAKCAKIFNLEQILSILAKDENIYVRKYVINLF